MIYSCNVQQPYAVGLITSNQFSQSKDFYPNGVCSNTNGNFSAVKLYIKLVLIHCFVVTV